MHSYVGYPERPFMEGTKLTNPVADGIARAFAVKTKPAVVRCLTSAIQMSAWRRYPAPRR
jgi:hypothetical protein